jgi:hypothetical protein
MYTGLIPAQETLRLLAVLVASVPRPPLLSSSSLLLAVTVKLVHCHHMLHCKLLVAATNTLKLKN